MPVAQQCEANAVPCITGDTPWQPWFDGSGRHRDEAPLTWSHHFFWGLEDVAAVVQDMWKQVPTNKKVAALFPNDSDGQAFIEPGAFPGLVKEPAGYTFDDPGLYPIGTQDFSSQISRFKKNDDQILVGVLPPPELRRLLEAGQAAGLQPQGRHRRQGPRVPGSAIEALGDLGTNLGAPRCGGRRRTPPRRAR